MRHIDSLIKSSFMKVANDIIDNYEKYTLKERFEVLKLMKDMVKVNKPLKSYDCKEIVKLEPKEEEKEKEVYEKYFR